MVQECLEDGNRFEKPIKRTKIVNLATENFENKNKSKVASPIAQAKGTRNVFDQLLYLSVRNKLDLRAILGYPLTSEPACFAHSDGTIRDSAKSKVAHVLKDNVSTKQAQAPELDTVIINVMFLLRQQIERLSTYQKLDQNILKEALNMKTKRVDLVFYVYKSPSIKAIERKSRGNEETFIIYSNGPKQKIESSVKELLANTEYKRELRSLLSSEYEIKIYAPIKFFIFL